MRAPGYYQQRTGMSRGQDDGTAKKYVCTWLMEYFWLDKDGFLSAVNEYEDKFIYRSPAAVLPLPTRAEPSTAEAYGEALARCVAKENAAKEQQDKEKAFKKLLASGNIYGSIEPEEVEAGPAAPAPFLSDFTVIDLEFQGTSILELAAVRYQNWEPIAELVSFVRFTEPINSIVATLTGITAADVAGAPSEKEVLQWLRGVAGDSVIVCHNLNADRRVLEATRTRLGAKEPLPNAWLCTLALAKQRRPGRSHKLGDLCRDVGLSTQGAHRALNDVHMCFGLLREFHQEQPVGPDSIHGAPSAKRPAGKRSKAAPGPLFSNAA